MTDPMDIVNAQLAANAARAKANADKVAAAKKLAKEKAAERAKQARLAEAQDEYLRLNYFKMNSHLAYLAAVHDLPLGGEWVNPADYEVEIPSVEEWAALTKAQKNKQGSVGMGRVYGKKA